MSERNKNFYSLEELKRAKDCYKGYQDGEEVYYFVGTLRYACDEIERLNNIINIILDFNLFKDECPLCLDYLEKCDEEKAQDVFYEEEYCENCSDDYKKCWLKYFNRLQELKGSDKE